MKAKLLFLLMLGLLATGGLLVAQDTATDDDGPTSNIDVFFVVCEDRAILDFVGVAQPGIDIFYQVFTQAGGTGDPLTDLRRVVVDGDYTVSQSTPFNNGATVPLGTFGSAVISLARESNSSNTIFDTTVDDIQDGCAEPSYNTVDSTTSGGTTVAGTPQPGEIVSSSGIFTPDGGVLNPVVAPVINPEEEPVVVIGARPSDTVVPGRTANPGLIFAECDDYPLADPGVIYDTDTIRVFWSWFAKTPELVREHIDTAVYRVTLNGQSFPRVTVSPVVERAGDYWVFYSVNLGDKWRPGQYGVSFQLRWNTRITDGYEDFGPNSPTPVINSSCTFEIQPNPYNIEVVHEQPAIPLKVR